MSINLQLPGAAAVIPLPLPAAAAVLLLTTDITHAREFSDAFSIDFQ